MVREAEQKNKKTLKASSSHLCCVVSLHTTCAGRASQDECVKLFYAHRRCHSCRADYRWWIALHGERWELRWGAAQSDITFCFTWTGAAMQGKNPWLRAITEMQSVIINEHRKVERLENFLSSSALKTLSALKPGEPCWQRGLERKKKKSPSEIPLTQTTTRCLMRLWQPWPISRTPLWQEWSKMLEQMLLLFRLPPCGFFSGCSESRLPARGDVGPSRTAITSRPTCVRAPHSSLKLRRARNNTSPAPALCSANIRGKNVIWRHDFKCSCSLVEF